MRAVFVCILTILGTLSMSTRVFAGAHDCSVTRHEIGEVPTLVGWDRPNKLKLIATISKAERADEYHVEFVQLAPLFTEKTKIQRYHGGTGSGRFPMEVGEGGGDFLCR